MPDFYQGSELWDLTLVDPDNRRPVNFPARREALDRVDALLVQPELQRAPGIAGARQADIDDDEMRFEFVHQCHRFGRGAGFATDNKTVLGIDQADQALAQYGMVVDQKDAFLVVVTGVFRHFSWEFIASTL